MLPQSSYVLLCITATDSSQRCDSYCNRHSTTHSCNRALHNSHIASLAHCCRSQSQKNGPGRLRLLHDRLISRSRPVVYAIDAIPRIRPNSAILCRTTRRLPALPRRAGPLPAALCCLMLYGAPRARLRGVRRAGFTRRRRDGPQRVHGGRPAGHRPAADAAPRVQPPAKCTRGVAPGVLRGRHASAWLCLQLCTCRHAIAAPHKTRKTQAFTLARSSPLRFI